MNLARARLAAAVWVSALPLSRILGDDSVTDLRRTRCETWPCRWQRSPRCVHAAHGCCSVGMLQRSTGVILICDGEMAFSEFSLNLYRYCCHDVILCKFFFFFYCPKGVYLPLQTAPGRINALIMFFCTMEIITEASPMLQRDLEWALLTRSSLCRSLF